VFSFVPRCHGLERSQTKRQDRLPQRGPRFPPDLLTIRLTVGLERPTASPIASQISPFAYIDQVVSWFSTVNGSFIAHSIGHIRRWCCVDHLSPSP